MIPSGESATEAFPLPLTLQQKLQETGTEATATILVVSVKDQTLQRLDRAITAEQSDRQLPCYRGSSNYVISTSRFGVGQVKDSNRTPLGLHRIAQKIGDGQPLGTVFRGRQPVGLLSEGMPEGGICHRILWLEGLEPGWNRGGDVDTFERYIYIHGFHDETTMGRPTSLGCIHMFATDLLPLFDSVAEGTLVWIEP